MDQFLGLETGYSFHQDSADQITVVFNVPDEVTTKDMDVQFTRGTVRAGVKGKPPIVQGKLYATIKPEDSLWQIESNASPRQVQLHLEKVMLEDWPVLVVADLPRHKHHDHAGDIPVDDNLNGDDESHDALMMDPHSELLLAERKRQGSMHFPQDEKACLAHFKRAADRGNVVACLEYGGIMEAGGELSQSSTGDPRPDLALKYYMKAAEHGSPYGKFKAAQMLLSGAGVDKDEQAGIKLLEEAAAANCPPALYACAQLPHMKAQKVQLLLAAANGGMARAFYELGEMHFYGRDGCPIDNEAAVRFYDHAHALDPSFEIPEDAIQALLFMPPPGSRSGSGSGRADKGRGAPQGYGGHMHTSTGDETECSKQTLMLAGVALLLAVGVSLWLTSRTSSK